MNEKKQSVKPKRKVSVSRVLKAHPKLSMFLNALFAIFLFSICMFVSYIFWIQAIGDGAYKYSDDTYVRLEDTIAACSIPDVGLDVLELQKEVSKFVVSYEHGKTELVCGIKDGYFNAEVTAVLSENYTITDSFRNYNSLEEYMRGFWLDFGLRVFLSAALACCLLEAIFFVSTGLIAQLSKASTKHTAKEKELTENNPTDALAEGLVTTTA